jgi:hypothetical protein
LITAFMAPLAAQIAPKAPKTTAKDAAVSWPAALSCAVSMASITAPGATTPRNSLRSS